MNELKQFLIFTPEGLYFQSYDDLIAFRGNKNMNIQYAYNNFEDIYLDINKWNFYKATEKYRNVFLDDARETETKRRIKEGKYRLIDLNNPTAKPKGGESFEEVIEGIKKSYWWRMKFLGLKFK